MVIFTKSKPVLLYKLTKNITNFNFRGFKALLSLPLHIGRDFHSILKIESAHTKDIPRGSTAMMRLEDSERAKSGKYIGALEEF